MFLSNYITKCFLICNSKSSATAVAIDVLRADDGTSYLVFRNLELFLTERTLSCTVYF